MTGLLGLALLRPWWLAALPLLLAAALLARRRAGRDASAWTRAVDPPLLAALDRLGRILPPGAGRGLGPAGLALAAAAVIVPALAGPATETRDGRTFRNLDGVVLMVELGERAAAADRLPAALTAARLVAEAAGTRPVALVVYAGDAYLASGFTTDADALGTTIAVLDGETVPNRGARPERALALARRLVAEAAVVTADLVLVAPDAPPRPAAVEAARAIAADGHRLSVLASAPAPDGTAGGLDALARIGGGAAAGAADPRTVIETVADRPTARLAGAGLAALVWTDHGRALLALALLPALLLFRRIR